MLNGRTNDRSTDRERNSNGIRTETNLAEQSKDETSKDEQNDARADLDAFAAVRFRTPTPRQRTFMDAYCRTFDETGPDRAARLIWANPDDPIGAMKADLQEFREARRAEG